MRILLGIVLAAIVLTGCGGDADTTPPADPTPTQDARPGGQPEGDVVTIAMRDIAFVPDSVTVTAGQVVRWVNEDDVAHDADATSGADFESDLFGQGETFEWLAEGPGTVEYVCSVHPGMTGTITVE